MSESTKVAHLRGDFRKAFKGSRRVALWAAGLGLAAWLLSGITSIDANQVGFVRRFGKVVRGPLPPGLTVLLPRPIEHLDTVSTKDVRRAEGGFSSKTAAIHVSTKESLLTLDVPYCLTSDQNIVHVSMVAQYQVTDPQKYLYDVASGDALLVNLLNDAILSSVARMSVDEVLTTEKERLRFEARKSVQDMLDGLGAGISVTDLQLEVPPAVPAGTQAAFQRVVDAKVGMQTARFKAEEQAKRINAEAEGEAAAVVAKARSDGLARFEQARGDAQRFLAVLGECVKDPQVTRLRMYLETMEEIMGKAAKYVVPPGRGRPIPPGAAPAEPRPQVMPENEDTEE